MPTPAPPTRASLHKGEAGAVESGLTGEKRRPEHPIIFGQVREQERLLQIAREGVLRVSRTSSYNLILGSGMVTQGLERGSRVLRLDGGHPAADLVRKVLAELGGFPVSPQAKKSGAQPTIIYPLAALYPVSFRILLQLIVAEEPLDIATLRRRLPDYFQNSIVNTTTRLLRDRVLGRDRRGCISLSETLPPSLPALVLAIADYLAVEDPRLADRPTVKGVRPAAFLGCDDGAPRLFGSDLRLRNLMALAVHGPMLHVELGRIVGNPKTLGEDEGNAPFGRVCSCSRMGDAGRQGCGPRRRAPSGPPPAPPPDPLVRNLSLGSVCPQIRSSKDAQIEGMVWGPARHLRRRLAERRFC